MCVLYITERKLEREASGTQHMLKMRPSIYSRAACRNLASFGFLGALCRITVCRVILSDFFVHTETKEVLYTLTASLSPVPGALQISQSLAQALCC